MDTTDLQLLKQTYESHSFSEAAKKVFKSPQGVAKTIAKLETELGVKLFERGNTGIQPTHYGHSLYQRSQELDTIFAEIRTSSAQARPFHHEVVSVFATMGFLEMLSFDFWRAFYQAHPEIILNLVEFPDSALTQRINDHQINLAFVSGTPNFEQMDGQFVMTNPFVVILSPEDPLAQSECLTPQQLAQTPQAIMGREYAVLNRHIQSVQKTGETALTNRALETSTISYILDFVQQRLGIGIIQAARLKRSPIRELLAQGKLVTRPLTFTLDRDVFFVSRNTTLLTAGEKQLKVYINQQKKHLKKHL